MRHALRAILVGGLGFAVAVIVAACGSSSGLLSSDQANTLNDSLSKVASAIDASHCAKAGSAAQDFSNQVAHISPSLKSSLANNLKQASQALSAQAQPGCEDGQTKSIPTTTKSTPTTSTPTRQATTQTTTSTPTAPTDTSTGQSTTSSATTQAPSGTTSTPSGGAGLGGDTPTTSTNGSGSGGAAPGTGNGT